MNPLQNMPGRIVGADTDARTITVQIPLRPEVTMGDAVIVSSVPEIAPRVGDVDRRAVARWLMDAGVMIGVNSRYALECAFARHRENAR